MKRYLKSFFLMFSFRGFYQTVSALALAVCMSVALMLVLYVDFERSYDTFHNNDRIYRAESRLWQASELTDNWATTSYGHAPMMTSTIPGIEESVRITAQDREQVVSFEDRAYAETRYAYTEPAFFRIFHYPIIDGDRSTPLDRPNTAVISRSAAMRYFGVRNPVGEKLTFRNQRYQHTFEVTAVMEDMPRNSNLNYDFLLSYATIPSAMQDVWYIHGVYTYLSLRAGVSPRQIEAMFASQSAPYRPRALEHKEWCVELIPLTDIHLMASKPYEKEAKGNAGMLDVLLIMAFALMVVAWLNMLNLTLVKSLCRVREFVLRNVYGAGKGDTMRQCLLDAALINCAAMVVAIALLFVICPLLSSFMGITIDATRIGSLSMLFIVLLEVVVGTLIVGLYPAIALMSVKITSIMRGNFASSRASYSVRRLLVGFQFSASFVLIAGTLVIYGQLQFMHNQPLGINTKDVMVVKYPPIAQDMETRLDGFRRTLLTSPSVSDISMSGAVPGMDVANYFAVRRYGSQPSEGRLMQMLVSDTHYPSFYGLNFVAGAGFVADAPGQSNKVIVNEEVLPQLGFISPDEAVGKLLSIEVVRDSLEIIGVVRNFHQQALNEPYKPIVILSSELLPMVSVPYISIRLASGAAVEDMIETVNRLYDEYFPSSPIDYFLLSNFYTSQYGADDDFGEMFSFSAALTLLVALLGLWIMSLFSIRRRFNEICLRKIYGASLGTLYWVVIREVIGVWFVASILGALVSWYLMQLWLSSYAFVAGIGWWVFPLSAGVLLVCALLTVTRETMRAVHRNPVDIFRTS